MDKWKRGQAIPNVVGSSDWADPDTIDDLAVDTRKIGEIKSWLLQFRNKAGVLLLTGPTGCGKTSTVRCIAKCLGFDLREWVTPLDRHYRNDAEFVPPQSPVTKFEDFLCSCSRYNSLYKNDGVFNSLLLVEDYPNIFLSNSQLFHEVLMRYPSVARSPIIFICTDVSDQGLSLALDLFPSHIQMKLGMKHISLNPITRTRMTAAVKRLGSLLHKHNPSFKLLSNDSMVEICDNANGDVRYAMLSLQMKPLEDTAALFDLAFKARTSKRSSSKAITKEEVAVTSCGKDDRVGLLHAVGRVLYPKWYNLNEKHNAPKRKRLAEKPQLNAAVPGVQLVHSPSAIVDSFDSMASTFLSFVHENYLNTFSTIESLAAAATCLSQADVMMTGESYVTSHAMSFDFGVRGVMMHNMVPNRAWNPVRRPAYSGILNTKKEINNKADALFRHYHVSSTVLIMDYLPFIISLNHSNMSHDQKRFVETCALMESVTNFCEALKSSQLSSSQGNAEHCKATMYLEQTKDRCDMQDDELRISEDDSDEEIDEGSQNLTMLEAVIDEEERQKQNYLDFLNDSEADILLSQL